MSLPRPPRPASPRAPEPPMRPFPPRDPARATLPQGSPAGAPVRGLGRPLAGLVLVALLPFAPTARAEDAPPAPKADPQRLAQSQGEVEARILELVGKMKSLADEMAGMNYKHEADLLRAGVEAM